MTTGHDRKSVDSAAARLERNHLNRRIEQSAKGKTLPQIIRQNPSPEVQAIMGEASLAMLKYPPSKPFASEKRKVR